MYTCTRRERIEGEGERESRASARKNERMSRASARKSKTPTDGQSGVESTSEHATYSVRKKIGTYRERERETERDNDKARGEERQRVMVNQFDSPPLQWYCW